MTDREIKIDDFDYALPEGRIAKYPLQERDLSKLLVWNRDGAGSVEEGLFRELPVYVPAGTMMIMNDTRVVKARLLMHKESGARIEIFCLEPHEPADYERAFAARGTCRWRCIVGNSKKWKAGTVRCFFPDGETGGEFTAERVESAAGESIVEFRWTTGHTFGQILEILGRVPIPPYLGRESESVDEGRYQTVYSLVEGSVAAPTAGLHFTENVLAELSDNGVECRRVTLHVGAGTFLPVKDENAAHHPMHVEHFEIPLATVGAMIGHYGKILAVGTTTVRTLESAAGLGYRILQSGSPRSDEPVGQWELYDIPEAISGKELLRTLHDYMIAEGLDSVKASTRIMITPGFRFRTTDMLITNFHQPRSTLLLLVSAFTGGRWREIYDHALRCGYRFLSYGDSSLLFRDK